MLVINATPGSIQESVLVFESAANTGLPLHEEIVFITGKLKPIIRGLDDGYTRDPAAYIYEPVNYLFSMFPTDTQYRIFCLYRDIELEIVNPSNGLSVVKNVKSISNLVASLFDILTIEMLSLSIERNPDIYIPELNNDRYSRSVISKPYSGLGLESEKFDGAEDSAKYSEYKTEDYRGLITLSMVARLLIPIFGIMIEYIDKDIEPKFKSFVIFRIIYKSWIQECGVMNKYRHYLAYQTSQNIRNKYSASMEGLSEDQIPEYIAADTFVKKMGVFDLYKKDHNHNLIKMVYNYATNTVLGGLDKRFGGSVQGKTPPKEKTTMNGDEDKTGVLEDNVTKTNISIGERIVEDHLVAWYPVEESFKLLLGREATKEELKLQKEIHSLLRKFEPDGLTGNFRDSVTANICDPISSASMYSSLEAEAAYKNQSLAISKLIIKEHYDVAALCMSEIDESHSGWIPIKPSQITKDNRDIIYSLYNIWYPDASANKNNSFYNGYISTLGPSVLTDQRHNNPGVSQINFWVTKLLTNNYYKSRLPERYLTKCVGYSNNENYNYQRPNNINNILAALVIMIASENQNTN